MYVLNLLLMLSSSIVAHHPLHSCDNCHPSSYSCNAMDITSTTTQPTVWSSHLVRKWFEKISEFSDDQCEYQDSKLLVHTCYLICGTDLTRFMGHLGLSNIHSISNQTSQEEIKCTTASREIKSDNLHYNTLVHWANGTNDSSTKRRMFQVFFFIISYRLMELNTHFCNLKK